MPRIKLAIHKAYPFACEFQVRVGDLNYGAHVGNSEMVGILHDARVALFRAMGINEADLGDGKTGIIMNELAVNYRAEGRLLDDIIIHSAFSHIKTASLRMCHLVTRGEETIALAEVGIVTFDYTQKCIAPIPDGFLSKID